MTTDAENIRLIAVRSGAVLPFESISITETFLTPCQSFEAQASSELSPYELARKFAADTLVQIRINDDVILTGYIDECSLENSRSGRKVSIKGRDILGSVVDGHIDPRMQVGKNTLLKDLISQVLTSFGLDLGLVDSNTARSTLTGKPAPAPWSKSKHKRNNPIKDFKPKENEGGFAYLQRILAQYGYWLWASYDGTYVVVAGPDYDQKPTYEISDAKGKNRILHSIATTNTTSLPSHVYVRGQDAARGPKQAIKACSASALASRFKPVYLSDKRATSQEKADRLAALFLAKHQKEFFHYECTLQGFYGESGDGPAIYSVDTVANINDTQLGVSGSMWCESRTFRQSRSGSTTDLKFIPLDSLLLDVPEGEELIKKAEVKSYEDASREPAKNTGPIVSETFQVGNVVFYAPTTNAPPKKPDLPPAGPPPPPP